MLCGNGTSSAIVVWCRNVAMYGVLSVLFHPFVCKHVSAWDGRIRITSLGNKLLHMNKELRNKFLTYASALPAAPAASTLGNYSRTEQI